MKKQCKRFLFPVLLTLAMVLVAIPFFVQAAAVEPYHSTHDTPWEATSGIISGGEGCNYYLTGDLTATADIVVVGKVNLCLNGHTLNMGESSIRPGAGAEINICDCSAEGKGTIISDEIAIYADSYHGYNGDVTVYSGNITGRTAISNKGTGTISVLGGSLQGVQYGIDNITGTTVVSAGTVSAVREAAIQNTGTLIVNGGTVHSEKGLAVKVISGGSFSLSGAPAVYGGVDVTGQTMDDIELPVSTKIAITAPLTYGKENKLSVYVSNATYPCTFTSGWQVNMGEAAFDDYFEGSRLYVDKYKLRKGADGELQFTEHMHSWTYEVQDNVLTARCTREDGLACPLVDCFGGTLTVNAPADLVYNMQEKTATMENTLIGGVPAILSEITYEKNNGEGWESSSTPVAVGEYRAILTIDAGLTSETRVMVAFAIAYLDTADTAEISCDAGNGLVGGVTWYKGDVTLQAPVGYTISALGTEYVDAITVSGDREGDYPYYLKDSEGYIAKKTVSICIDTQGPLISSTSTGVPGTSTFTVAVSATDPRGVAEYRMTYWKSATPASVTTISSQNGSFYLTGLDVYTAYSYSIVAVDKLGNVSEEKIGDFQTAKPSIEGATILIGGSYVYNGTEILPADVTVMLGGQVIDAGQYLVSVYDNVHAGTATLIVTAKEGSSYSGSVSTKFEIAPCPLAGANATIDTPSFSYNGMAQAPTLTVTANGETLGEDDYTIRYLRNGMETTDITSAGTITVCLVGKGNYTGEKEIGNYTIARVALIIQANMQAVRLGESIGTGLDAVTINGLVGGDVLVSITMVQSTHLVQCSNAVLTNAAGDDVLSNYVIEYRAGLCHTLEWDPTHGKLCCTDEECDYKQGEADVDAPTGTLTVTDGSYSTTVNGFYSSIPENWFTNKELMVTITAQDALSGLAKVEYLWGYDAAVQTEQQLAARTDWLTCPSEGFAIAVKDGARVVVYARLTDKAGNVTYLSFDRGVVFDTTPPEIGGVESGKTYYVTQQITIADLFSGIQLSDLVNCGWELTSVNGKLHAVLTLAGDTDCVYQFRLSDMVGNAAANGELFVITMKPISALSQPIDHLTIDNVTGYDAKILREVRDAVVSVDTTFATDGEKAALKAILDKCDMLLAKVQNVEEVIKHASDLLAGYDIDTVTSADRAVIAQVADDLVATEAGNDLTDEQREALIPLQEKAAALLGRIDETAAELTRIKNIANGYDPDTVTLDDRAVLNALLSDIDALLVGKNLTTTERAELIALRGGITLMLDQLVDVAAEIARLAAALAQYHEDTVKSSDKAAIDEILLAIDELLGSRGVTEGEKAELTALRSQAVALLNKIAAVAAEIDRLTQATASYDIDTVTTREYSPLQKLSLDFSEILDGQNLTETERNALLTSRNVISACLVRLDSIEAERKRVNALYASYETANLKESDRASILRLIDSIDVLLSYTNHTEEERAALEALRVSTVALLDKIGQTDDDNALLDQLYAYKTESVKSSDKQAISDMLAEIHALCEDTGLTDEQRTDLENGAKYANALLNKIAATLAELDRVTKAVAGYDAATVTSADRDAIALLIANMQTLLNGDNLTADERGALNESLQNANALLAEIDQNLTELDRLHTAIGAYDVDTVASADRAAIEQLIADINALLDGSNLTDDERATLAEDLATANALLAEIEKDENAGSEDPEKPEDPVDPIDPLEELSRLLAAVNGYDIETVKSTDRADIETLIADMDKLAQSTGLSDTDRASLAEGREKADALLARIEAAAQAPITENTQAAAGITAENFALADRQTLKAAKADIEKALADYDGNYTDAEKQALRDEMARLDAVMHAMDRVEAVQEALDSLPEAENFNRNDITVKELIEAIEKAYAQLTERELELVDRSRLDAILAILADYDIVVGNGNSWQKGSNFSLSFQANGPYEEFVGVKIDGVLLDASNYLVLNRDTAVNLLPAYLETLATGEHTITILYVDDEAAGTFRITEAVAGNEGNNYLWIIIVIIILCLAGGAVAVYFVMKKERKPGKKS
ncbi:MAG: hypothetical protein IJY20_04485 [Clostridia bacterium]|nr:hypothetical protein [Clostridia bacterium]